MLSAAAANVLHMDTTTTLTETEAGMLELERSWWQYAGAKEAEARARFDLSITRYYQLLNDLIDREVALAHDPLTVKRLRRIRAARQRSRSTRRASASGV